MHERLPGKKGVNKKVKRKRAPRRPLDFSNLLMLA